MKLAMHAIYLQFLLVLFLALVLHSFAAAEIVDWDKLLKEYVRAGERIANGEDRRDVLVDLEQAVRNNPSSSHQEHAKRLARDLSSSIAQAQKRTGKRATLDSAPELFLSETTFRTGVLHPSYPEKHLPRVLNETPRDPMVLLIRRGRGSIEKLIPELRNDSPTRQFSGAFSGRPSVPRVSGQALALIEYLSQCRFRKSGHNPSSPEEAAQQREELIRRIEEWWRENKDRSVVEGIRAQLPHAGLYEKSEMAENLLRAAGDKSPEDRKYAFEVLKQYSEYDWGYVAVRSARVLAKYGDFTSLAHYRERIRKALDTRGVYQDHGEDIVYFLLEFGGRDEWELVHEVAVKELEHQEQMLHNPCTWLSMVYTYRGSIKGKERCPYGIPALGLALNQMGHGARPDFDSSAYDAAEMLQRDLGIDFGFRPESSKDARKTALLKAQKWWAEEGKAKYTFDYIEEHLVKKQAESPK